MGTVKAIIRPYCRSLRVELRGVESLLHISAAMAFFFICACSVIPPSMPPVASVEGVSGHFRIGQIIHLETGKTILFDELIDQLGCKELIFVGEVHDNPEHHLMQVQILQALMTRYNLSTVAMEFFQEPEQPILDRYFEGAITEDAFLSDVGWFKRWAYNYHLYRPIMLITKDGGGRILAINAPRVIVRKVARNGLGSLDPSERNQLANDIDLGNQSHRTYLRKAYEIHNHADLKRFDYFYEAQCVWEDTMAENIAEHLTRHREKLAVFLGNGHIINKFGVPNRTLSRIQVSAATVLLQPLTSPTDIRKESGDYIWLTRDCSGKKLMNHPKK
jgi:uncharacterized iron-regulated protein